MWPRLPFESWRETKETLHRYVQIVGKIQLALTPAVNHWWNVTLHLTARGLATSALPCGDGRTFDIELDLVGHHVVVRTSSGEIRRRELQTHSVADLRSELFEVLESLGIHVTIWDRPVELKSEAIPFAEDHAHATYDPVYVGRFFGVLTSAARVLEEFRARFIGKCSGVGFYWGTFDLSVARYSGRRAPEVAGTIERNAYSHEVSEVGFWPGDAVYRAPAFFALQYPMPDGFARAAVRPAQARWEESVNCFVLPYEDLREPDVSAKAMEFFESTYAAGASLAGWNRAELERAAGPPPFR